MLEIYLLLALSALDVSACNDGCIYTGGQQPVYNGHVNKTVFGKTCDFWPVDVPELGQSTQHNYCRVSGNGEATPSCITGAETNYCDVGSFECPLCENPPPPVFPAPILTSPCRLPPTPKTDPRIVGGVEVKNYEYQFFAQVAHDRGDSPKTYCGGTLIHPNWVLTATHCFEPERTGIVSLGARTIDVSLTPVGERQCWETHTFGPSQVFCHPGYDPNTYANDWCLIKLAVASKYKPIRLFNSELGMENLEAEPLTLTVIGTGIQQADPLVWDLTLHKTFVAVASQALCFNLYQGYDLDSMLCVGYMGGGFDACQGDSGAPLFTHRLGEFWQVGVVSYGVGCANANTPAVYARINSMAFREWVCSTSSPTRNPTTKSPTNFPSKRPTKSPTNRPTKRPTKSPVTKSPTPFPTRRPTRSPSLTKPPTPFPSRRPTKSPTYRPTKKPTKNPTTKGPTPRPTTREPSFGRPTRMPTERPTRRPTKSPATKSPTHFPTHRPTKSPTIRPTTKEPTARPTRLPTKQPSTRSPTKPQLPLCTYLYPHV